MQRENSFIYPKKLIQILVGILKVYYQGHAHLGLLSENMNWMPFQETIIACTMPIEEDIKNKFECGLILIRLCHYLP